MTARDLKGLLYYEPAKRCKIANNGRDLIEIVKLS